MDFTTFSENAKKLNERLTEQRNNRMLEHEANKKKLEETGDIKQVIDIEAMQKKARDCSNASKLLVKKMEIMRKYRGLRPDEYQRFMTPEEFAVISEGGRDGN
jgi:hypothetical protein